MVALRSYVVEDRHAVGSVVELTIARAKQCIANREDVVLIVVTRVPRVPRFHGVERFGFLALVELLEGIADFLFADFARNLHATVDDLLDGIEVGVEIRSARSERAAFALVVRRFTFEKTSVRDGLTLRIVVRFVLFGPSTQQGLRVVDEQTGYEIGVAGPVPCVRGVVVQVGGIHVFYYLGFILVAGSEDTGARKKERKSEHTLFHNRLFVGYLDISFFVLELHVARRAGCAMRISLHAFARGKHTCRRLEGRSMRSLFIEEPSIESHTEGKFVFGIELPATDAARCVVRLHHNAVADAIVQTEHPHRGFQSLIHH